ncbi:MAG TPA: ATP-dependent DNA helicase, partial [Burkholderiales bacterium]
EELIAARRATRARTESGTYWIAAEQLPLWRAIRPESRLEPAIEPPAEFATQTWTADAALVELARARLQGLGPVTCETLARSLGVPESSMQATLLALESEGFVLRGSFSSAPPAGGARTESATEWCERRLLARIHRYTVERLRAEIEPVTAQDFMRFLFEWQGVTVEPRAEGPQALGTLIEQLEGFEAACLAWEADIFRVRMDGYDPDWLDSLCRAGRVVWTRLTPPKTNGARERAAGPVRTTPIAFFNRRTFRHWQRAAGGESAQSPLSHRAQAVADYLAQYGASFFEEIAHGTGLLKSEVEEALGELVALGRAQSDSFAGLRALLIPADKRRSSYRRRRAPAGIEEAGRWSLVRPPAPAVSAAAERAAPSAALARVRAKAAPTRPLDDESLEHIARTLLRRYGVVFRKVLTREEDDLPSWFDLLRVYRRLEARGEIRGGRFVAGFSGEQYALPEAVPMLRAVRRKPKTEQLVSISAADPLNLVGIVTPGARVPALAGNRVLYRDGIPIAVQIGGKAEFLIEVPEQEAWNARNALIRGAPAASTAAH